MAHLLAPPPPVSDETPRNALSLDRRTLLAGGVLSAGLAAMPLSAQTQAKGFTHGIASGEPYANGVLLWTRFVGSNEAKLAWQVSDSADFARVVAEGEALAGPGSDWCAKAEVTGLEPDSWYYYRFTGPDGSRSAVGRTRTLPVGPTGRFRLGVFSCSNMGFGYFNAYAHAAEANDLDLLLHLGDYFYEYGVGTYPDADQIAPGRTLLPETEIVQLADYRLRHATYRADPDLQRLTQLYPMILVWDDHESANDSWEGGAQNHQSETEGPWDVRKAASVRAYREWLPVSDDPWKAYEVGDLATLFRLETRLTARSQQLSIADVLAGNAILMQYISICAFFLDAFAHVTEAETGRAAGARNWSRLIRAFRLTSELALGFSLILSLGFLVLGDAFIAMMTTDAATRETARSFLIWCALVPLLGMPSWQLDGLMIGATRGPLMRNAMIAALAIYLMLDAVLRPLWGAHGLWLAFLLYYLARAGTLMVGWRGLKRSFDA